MKAFYSDHFVLPLPEGHRFPMQKYAMLRQRVVESCLLPAEDLLVPDAASDEQILRVHDLDYFLRLTNGQLSKKEIRRIGFPWSPQMVERSRRSVGGTIEACRAALQDGIAVNLAGGTHHAYPDHGEGFCVFNDIAVAARAMQAEDLVRRIAVIDCDVHQGNGTAAIFEGDISVFTFSIHGENNFPLHKEISDLDIALPDRTEDNEFLKALQQGAQIALEEFEPDLVLYLAGADPLSGDRLGRLSLTKAGLAARDRLVLGLCRSAHVPVVVTMSGGYARQVEDTVDIHFQTVKIALEYS